jgi:hypothetical protein
MNNVSEVPVGSQQKKEENEYYPWLIAQWWVNMS